MRYMGLMVALLFPVDARADADSDAKAALALVPAPKAGTVKVRKASACPSCGCPCPEGMCDCDDCLCANCAGKSLVKVLPNVKKRKKAEDTGEPYDLNVNGVMWRRSEYMSFRGSSVVMQQADPATIPQQTFIQQQQFVPQVRVQVQPAANCPGGNCGVPQSFRRR